MTRFLIVPQWQGSPAARAMLLVDGASAIAGDLPSRDTETLDVPLEAGESLGSGVHRLSALLRVREQVAASIAEEDSTAHPDSAAHPVVIGGDCSVTTAALASVDTSDVAVIWCDAHPDLHTPESSRSGAFSGMALRAILGEGEPRLALSPGVPPERIVLVGARSLDAGEEAVAAGLAAVSAADLESPESLLAAARRTGAARIWLHIDVDVLDPAELEGVSSPLPFGAGVSALTTAVRRLREELPLAGATIAGFAPRTPGDAVRDLGSILRLIGAVA